MCVCVCGGRVEKREVMLFDVLWASWICSLVPVFSFEKFLVVISSDISSAPFPLLSSVITELHCSSQPPRSPQWLCLLVLKPMCSPLLHHTRLSWLHNKEQASELIMLLLRLGYKRLGLPSWSLSFFLSLLDHFFWGSRLPWCEQPSGEAHIVRNWSLQPRTSEGLRPANSHMNECQLTLKWLQP